MDVSLKETVYVSVNGQEHVVRQQTLGTLRGKVVYFYDTTRTVAVGFHKSFCIENPVMFQIQRNLSERDVPLKEVLKVIGEVSSEDLRNPDTLRILAEKIKSL